jgi:hypothetical protein
MNLKRFPWLFLFVFAALIYVVPANADSVNTVKVDGTYAFADGVYGIPPYGGTLNGKSEAFYCVDFSSVIQAGDSWNVYTTNLTGSNFSSTRLNNPTSYLEIAWLVTQVMSTTNQRQQAEDQYAIWSFTGGPNPYGTNSSLVAAALAAVQGGFTGQGFEILTPTGSLGQEFLIFVPEPGELVLIVVGLLLLLIVQGKKLTGTRAALLQHTDSCSKTAGTLSLILSV